MDGEEDCELVEARGGGEGEVACAASPSESVSASAAVVERLSRQLLAEQQESAALRVRAKQMASQMRRQYEQLQRLHEQMADAQHTDATQLPEGARPAYQRTDML